MAGAYHKKAIHLDRGRFCFVLVGLLMGTRIKFAASDLKKTALSVVLSLTEISRRALKKASGSILVALGIISALYIAWHVAYPSGSWNYRMTVAIETPEGMKTGSAVRKISFSSEPSIFPGQGGTYYNVTEGEAVIVDLSKRGVVFAIMDGDYAHRVVLRGFPLKEKTNPGAEITLNSNQYPRIVQFRNLNNPKSVELIYGAKSYDEQGKFIGDQHLRIDRFGELFGIGVTLSSITIEITNAQVSHGIEQWLPWLSTMHGYLSGMSTSFGTELYNRLNTRDFIRKPKN
jgi:hypothetical protein